MERYSARPGKVISSVGHLGRILGFVLCGIFFTTSFTLPGTARMVTGAVGYHLGLLAELDIGYKDILGTIVRLRTLGFIIIYLSLCYILL